MRGLCRERRHRPIAARFAIAELGGRTLAPPPVTTALGALLAHVTGGADGEGFQPQDFQPMNVNFGLMPPPDEQVKKKDRKLAYTARARADMASWMHAEGLAEPA